MHFTFQIAFLTRVPSIYHPWDLQHVHLPELFSPTKRWTRELLYRLFCARARMVAAANEWTRRDLIEHYHLSEQKVRVVPIAAVLDAYREPNEGEYAAVRQRRALPDAFIFYPAQTWPHKNHETLLKSLAWLRDRKGLRIPLICSGRKDPAFFKGIESKIKELNLEDQVSFLGFVSAEELRVLYRLSRCVVFPTLFEGACLPMMEAFASGAPMACSKVTFLPELAGNAALFFDPRNPEDMGATIEKIWNDESLQKDLSARGKKRIENVTWDLVAKMFRAHYRRLCGRELAAEDRALIGS